MANMNCMFPVFFIQGDGASLTFIISLKTTPILFDRFTVLNFPKSVDAVTVVYARDSLNNDVSAQVSATSSGTAVTLSFTAPFTDQWAIQLRFAFIG